MALSYVSKVVRKLPLREAIIVFRNIQVAMSKLLSACFSLLIVGFLLGGESFSEDNHNSDVKGELTSEKSQNDSTAFTLTPIREAIYRDTWIDFNKNDQKDPYEDSALSIEQRLDDLLSRMTTEEKTCQLATLYGYQRVLKQDLPVPNWKEQVWKDGIANIDEHLNGIPAYQGKKDSDHVWPPSSHVRAINEVQKWFIEETRLGIPVDFTNEGIRGVCHRRATNFPAQAGIGATWDRELVAEIGKITGIEAKALGYTHIYSPILDLARDPRWGRVVECYGEDPFHVSALGVEQVRGLHESGVGSTCKHFAVYSVPKGGRDGEARTDPHVAPRELELIYLKPFEAAIRSGFVTGVMSSYNDYDAIPVSADGALMLDYLRGRIGFRGYVVSDSGAVKFLKTKHRTAPSLKFAAMQYLEAGGNVRTDFDFPERFILDVRGLISEGLLSMDIVDARVRDVLRVKMKFGLFDQPFVLDPEAADKIVRCQQFQDYALRAAQESIVLLKNSDRVLPLKKDVRSILVCGPNARAVGPCISRYGPTLGEVVTVLDGVRRSVSSDTKVLYAKGCEIVDDSWPASEIFPDQPNGKEEAMIEEAVQLAHQAEVVVAVLGESERTIGESKSRTDLNLTGHQNELVRRLHATGKPVVVVLLNGRALSINWIDRYIPAIVEAWFPGEACGTAIADVLFGSYNPGGKLPVTFPRTVGQLPFNFPFKPGSQAAQGKGDNPNGVGKSRITRSLYPFGFGLSYTSFSYGDLKIHPSEIAPGDSVQVEFSVTNTGDRTGDEVVQLYIRDDLSSVITYDTTLCEFDRISIEPGETRRVKFRIEKESMEIINRRMQRQVEPGSFSVFVGSSSEDFPLQGSFEVIEKEKPHE